MEQSFVKKFRPKVIKDLVGADQRKIATMLVDSLETTPIKMPMLLGPTGVGKTSIAQVYIRAILKDMTTENIYSHPAVVYYNSGKNGGIDSMRELVNNFGYTSFYSNVKIIVLDEIHRLTKDAQNVLLGETEEKLPDHVYIIACTTEKQGIESMLRGRFKQLSLTSPTKEEFKKSAIRIAKVENKTLNVSDFETLYAGCEGSVRVFQEDLETFLLGGYTTRDLLETTASLAQFLILKDPNKNIQEILKIATTIVNPSVELSNLIGYALKVAQNGASQDNLNRALLFVEIFGQGLSSNAKPRDSFCGLISSYMRVLRQ